MKPGQTFGIKPDAAKAWVELAYALRDLEDSGRPPVCQPDPSAWHSDDRDERAEAAEACRLSNCPALTLCDRFAITNGERFGVWAGIDRTPTTSRKRKSA